MDGTWIPPVDAPDNRPGSPVRPRWHLLLDDPAPARALVVGTVAPGVEAWLTELGASVRRVGRVGGLPSPADLVVVGPDEAAAVDGEALRWVARCCGPQGSLWLPGRRTPRREHLLRSHGFPVRRWDRLPRSRPPATATGVVACRRGPAARPPDWLVALGVRAGWGGDGRWSLTTPGAYPSQKSVAHLRPGPGGGRRLVVKVTQHPRFNGRLENEDRRLREVAASGPAAARRVPAVLGAGRVGGLAAVVEEGLEGRPFLEVSHLTADCGHAADAVAAVAAVGVATRGAVPGVDLAAAMGGLVDRFTARVQPSAAVEAVLRAQVDVVAAAPVVPTVMFHGDMGTWNLLVVDGVVRILDWESAAPTGPPLWDLFHLMRSYAVRSGRRRGRGRERSLARHLVQGSSLTDTFAGWVDHHCRLLAIDRQLVAPLFHLCWVHRAVKESARLADGRPGHYGPLCVRLAEERGAPGVRRLLGT